MSGFRRFEIYDQLSSPMFIRETSIFKPKSLTFPSFTEEIELGFALDLLTPNPFDFTPPCLIPHTPFDTIADLIQIKKTQKLETKLKLMSLCDRVSALELGFEKMVKAKKVKKDEDRKYSWIAEINSTEKDGINKKYEWTTEIKGGKKKEKSYKYVAEFKGKGKDSAIDRKYIFKASTTPAAKKDDGKKKKDEKALGTKRIVEIEEEPVNDQGAIVLKQAFAKRIRAGNNGKGKKKELSPQDAAMMIQMSFRAYLIRRSQVLRALRELAVAKAKLKEIRALFNNFSYRHRIARDAEERQKFSEKIIVLLLTVDGIEGADLMVRAARRSILDELEAILDVVDPQPAGKLGSMKRRKFDMPEGVIQQEIAAGVAEVVQMLDQDEKNGVNTFEVCL
ncbi:hypothetical protein AQUCO_01300704v1 [Aquilegia coerulea]|uniref:BAG domain-containing protein n=1 Tax=Aquilegia coerulea TaxID=218851 RepID=A0A2G5E330_AQUCA|nr:hypothetical protein AQUCO_01300704v1 [Aquilegia coerulea]